MGIKNQCRVGFNVNVLHAPARFINDGVRAVREVIPED